MKNYLRVLCCVILVLATPSCKKVSNFLDQAPGVSVNEDVIFSSKAQLEIFIATMYKYGVYSIAAYRDNSLSTTKALTQLVYHQFSETASDEGESNINFSQANGYWNSGTVNSSNIVNAEDTRFFQRFISLSQCNIIIARAQEVPGKDPAATAGYIKQVIGEAKFIRALNYMEMIKRYGGVPIVNKRFNPGDDINIPRSSFEDCINFIVSDCNDAMASGLPGVQPGAQTGRATCVAAAALKAKALLFAASPLFNTATPYMSMSNNKLICYGNYDINRWKLAADATKDALDSCTKYGYALIDNPANRDPAYNYPASTPAAQTYVSGAGYPLKAGNYKQAWEVPNNSEVLFADMGNGLGRIYAWPFAGNYPKAFGNTSFNYGVGVTQNFVAMYENKITGQPQAWNGGSDLQTIYDNLDPRFKQTVAFSGSYYNTQNPIVATYASTNGDATKAGVNFDAGGCPSEMWLKKYMPDALYNGGSGVYMTWPLLRINELYLSYAEAQNEFAGPNSTSTGTSGSSSALTPFDAINKIRTRSAMPNVPSGLTVDQFRAKVQHERAIELAFEDHRFWDVRRWKIADQAGIMKGPMYGQNINKLTAGGYSYSIFQYETRIFFNYEYLHGFDLTEVRKGYLVQNPGW